MTERSDFRKYSIVNIQYSFSVLLIPIHRMEIKMIQPKLIGSRFSVQGSKVTTDGYCSQY